MTDNIAGIHKATAGTGCAFPSASMRFNVGHCVWVCLLLAKLSLDNSQKHSGILFASPVTSRRVFHHQGVDHAITQANQPDRSRARASGRVNSSEGGAIFANGIGLL